MSLCPLVYQSISSLACFAYLDAKVDIVLITGGMSHTCYKVTGPSKTYFVKRLNQDTSATETLSAKMASVKGLHNKFSPAVVYADEKWLVTDFVQGTSLVSLEADKEAKIAIGLSLMTQLHKLPAFADSHAVPRLETRALAEKLISYSTGYLLDSLSTITSISQSLADVIDTHIRQSNTPHVLCHGDINFSNILVDSSNTPWLIDYECAHIAAREFDIAMFIAINNISFDQVKGTIEKYNNLAEHYEVNSSLVGCFLLYSYFINGLWYLDSIDKAALDMNKNKQLLKKLAQNQWSQFDSFVSDAQMELPKLASMLD